MTTFETREFQVRLEDEEARTVSGIAVPYGETISLHGFKERFERGAFQEFDETVKLLWQHEEPIGKITRAEETEEGYKIDAVISTTPRGDEAYTLLRDGVVDSFSVGFEPIEDRREGDVVVRTKARLREVSVVSFPAYSNAVVEQVREAQEDTLKEVSVEETQNTEVAELRSAIEDMDRRMTVMAESAPSVVVNEGPQFRSLGEWVKALGENDEGAHALYRAASWSPAGSVVADSVSENAWVSETIRLVDLGRPTMNAFRRATLPGEGMNVEYPQVKTNGLAVAQQSVEGEDLAYGKLSLETVTAPVKTFGGYTRMSFQVVQRSSVAYVDAAMRALAIEFGKVTNANVVAELEGATLTEEAWDGSAAGLFEVIANAAVSTYTEAGLRPQFLLAAPDSYVALATLFDSDDRPIVGGSAPVNNVGTANLPGLTGTIAGLPIIVDPALTAGGLYVANSEALVSYESGGAPLRLQDENIVNLSQDASMYGYEAVTIPIPEAIVSVTTA